MRAYMHAQVKLLSNTAAQPKGTCTSNMIRYTVSLYKSNEMHPAKDDLQLYGLNGLLVRWWCRLRILARILGICRLRRFTWA